MSWTLLCLLWVTLTSTLAYNNHRGYGPSDYYGADGTSPYARRFDYGPPANYPGYRRQGEESPMQQLNERSMSDNRGPLSVLSLQQSLEPIISQECQEIGVCERVPNYPQDVVNKIIAKLGPTLNQLKVEKLDSPSLRVAPGDEPEMELCGYKERVYIPSAARGHDGSWSFIINSPRNPLQGYRLEICHQPDSACLDNKITVFGGYTAVCKQKYVVKTMLAVNLAKEDAFEMPVRLPSCCSCVVRHTGRK